MFKGIVALFTSGVIFNPMILLGVISGSYVLLNFEPETIRALFSDYRFYAGIAVLSVIYTLFFARVYKEGGERIDWSMTALRMFFGGMRYLIAFVLAMSFIMMISIF